ncbi:MAG: MaoC/PaaZ C-terminal domain-containing protein [Bacillota bacterium]
MRFISADFSMGDTFQEYKKAPISRLQLVRFAGASGDFNPIHLFNEVGEKAGTGGVIAHGMLVMGMVGEAITHWVPRKALKKISVRFKGMTFPGDEITVAGKIIDVVKNGEGTRIVCEVTAKDQKAATEEEIINFCKERLTPYKVPKLVEFRTELPKSAVGKLLRRMLIDEEIKKQSDK